MVTAKSFTIRIRPGCEDEYRRRHLEVWPELTSVIKRHGFFNYSIFMNGTTLYAYMENCADFDEAFAAMQAEPISQKWRDYMSDIIIRDENMGFHFLDRVFRLD
jgi:L-rhamnose mutarotase